MNVKKTGVTIDLLDALNSLVKHDSCNYPDHCGLLITMDKWQALRQGCIKRGKPDPGSDEALEQGCLCPVLDNSLNERGLVGGFTINGNCPLHGSRRE